MTSEDVRKVLGAPYKPLALAALSYVNLTDRECNLLVLRHMRGHTQEETAEEMGYTVRAVQGWEKTALDKCAAAWENLILIQELLKAVQ